MIFIQWIAGLGLGMTLMAVGWAYGYKEGRYEQQIKIEKMRRALEVANRQS